MIENYENVLAKEIEINLLIADITRKDLSKKFKVSLQYITDALAGRVKGLRVKIIDYIINKRKGEWFLLPETERRREFKKLKSVIRKKQNDQPCRTEWEYQIIKYGKKNNIIWISCIYPTFMTHKRKGKPCKRRKLSTPDGIWEGFNN